MYSSNQQLVNEVFLAVGVVGQQMTRGTASSRRRNRTEGKVNRWKRRRWRSSSPSTGPEWTKWRSTSPKRRWNQFWTGPRHCHRHSNPPTAMTESVALAVGSCGRWAPLWLIIDWINRKLTKFEYKIDPKLTQNSINNWRKKDQKLTKNWRNLNRKLTKN